MDFTQNHILEALGQLTSALLNLFALLQFSKAKTKKKYSLFLILSFA